jgi:hypothetical protein
LAATKELYNQIFGIKNYVPPLVAPNVNSPSASTNPPGSSVPMTSSARYLATQVDIIVYYLLLQHCWFVLLSKVAVEINYYFQNKL